MPQADLIYAAAAWLDQRRAPTSAARREYGAMGSIVARWKEIVVQRFEQRTMPIDEGPAERPEHLVV